MIEPGDMTDQAEDTAPMGGAGGLDLFESRLAALVAGSGLFDRVARSCRILPLFRPRRVSPTRPRSGDGSIRQPQLLAGFRAGGAGGGGPGLAGIGRSSACRVDSPRAGAPVAFVRRPVPAAACPPSFARRDPVF